MIDPDVMYDNMMNKFKWGNAGNPSVYLDENNRRMFSNFRNIFSILGKELLLKGDTVKAIEVVERGLSIVSPWKMPNDYFSIGLAEIMIRTGKMKEGEKIINDILGYSRQYLEYAAGLKPEERFGLEYPTGINMQALLDIYNMSLRLKLTSLTLSVEPELNKYYSRLYPSK